jgi:hypothetical protein
VPTTTTRSCSTAPNWWTPFSSSRCGTDVSMERHGAPPSSPTAGPRGRSPGARESPPRRIRRSACVRPPHARWNRAA